MEETKQEITRAFCAGVTAGTLAAFRKEFPHVIRRDRSECQRIEVYHVRDTLTGARFFTITYEIEVEEDEIVEKAALVATHCAAKFGEMLTQEFKDQGVKPLHDILLLHDPLKDPVILGARVDGDLQLVVVQLNLWMAVPKILQDGVAHRIRLSPEEEEANARAATMARLEKIARQIRNY